MTTTAAVAPPRNKWANAFGKRQLSPTPTRAAPGLPGHRRPDTIMLYYLYYVEGAVTPLMLPYYHMSFQFFLYLLVVSNAIGAFTPSSEGSRTESAGPTSPSTEPRWWRSCNSSPSRTSTPSVGFAVAYCIIGFVEGDHPRVDPGPHA